MKWQVSKVDDRWSVTSKEDPGVVLATTQTRELGRLVVQLAATLTGDLDEVREQLRKAFEYNEKVSIITPDTPEPTIEVELDAEEEEPASSPAEIEEESLVAEVLAELGEGASKRAQIRALASRGLSTTKISKILGVRYQMVYNTLHEQTASKEVPEGAGVCRRCGRVLTDPEHVAQGIGPICAGKI